MVYLLVILLNSLVIISENGYSRENARNNLAFSIYSGVYILLLIPVLCFIFPLLCFHVYLIMTDQTTYEYYKSQEQTKGPSNKMNPKTVKIQAYKIMNAPSVFRANINECNLVAKLKKETFQEKEPLCNKVNKDLIVDYKNIQEPPSERFFNTYGQTREETKQSLNYKENKRTSRENFNTESSLNDNSQTKINLSHISDKSVRMKEVHTSDSMEVGSNKLKLNLKIYPKPKEPRNRRSCKRRNGTSNLKISNLIKIKGQNRNMNNLLTLQKKQGDSSRPESPYFSAECKNKRVHAQKEHSQISNNPLASATAFQHSHAQMYSGEERKEMKIEDKPDLFRTPKVQIIGERLNSISKDILIPTTQTPLKSRNSGVSQDIKCVVEQSQTAFIIPEKRNSKINYKGRENIFEESVRGINSISVGRKTYKTPVITENANKAEHTDNFHLNTAQKQSSRKISVGIAPVSDLNNNNSDSLHMDKTLLKPVEPQLSPHNAQIVFAIPNRSNLVSDLLEKELRSVDPFSRERIVPKAHR
ncbi:unnamed protein product [Moneuplotes crassus]|uniref:Palmitoyltransferase n=1 Tax=Euplotes crassus TaxID=5936 RepID=A0AAD1TZ04_EUPCR|nr:unnamed protein product [Moneuplotes crassus]